MNEIERLKKEIEKDENEIQGINILIQENLHSGADCIIWIRKLQVSKKTAEKSLDGNKKRLKELQS